MGLIRKHQRRSGIRLAVSHVSDSKEMCIALEDGLAGWAQVRRPALQVVSARKPFTLSTV